MKKVFNLSGLSNSQFTGCLTVSRILSFSLVLAAFFLAVGCGNSSSTESVQTKEEKAAASGTAATDTFQLNTDGSKLTWTGKKLLGDSHTGTIEISKGFLALEGGVIKAGSFVVDMATISETSDNAVMKAKLEGHLASPDFFDVGNFPSTEFVITGIQAAAPESGVTHMIAGNLMIKGTGKNITIPAKVTVTDSEITATSDFAINRADFNVQYGSKTFFDKILDKDIIDDQISFSLSLKATKAVKM